jgi:hypothetical protein
MTTLAKALAVVGLGLSALIPSAAMACEGRVGEVVVVAPRVGYREAIRRHERFERREGRREERVEQGRFRRF